VGSTPLPFRQGVLVSDAGLAELREAFAALAAPAQGCAPAERIFDAATGQLAPDEARTLLAHNLGCADCTAAWRLAREIAAEARLLPAPVQPRAIRWRRPAIAAGLAAAASLLLLPLSRRTEPPPPP